MVAVVVLDRAAPTKGNLFLTLGGAGGIGSYAIQIAAQQGIQVIALAKTGDLE
jgi:NADPH:quinone reductase-like Zn-dependent oxidoreductase